MEGTTYQQADEDVYYVHGIVEISKEAEKRGDFLEEFADAHVAEKADPRVFDIGYHVVAPTSNEAYRRAANLIHAKAAAGGWSGKYNLGSLLPRIATTH
jgi:hypothetical protein